MLGNSAVLIAELRLEDVLLGAIVYFWVNWVCLNFLWVCLGWNLYGLLWSACDDEIVTRVSCVLIVFLCIYAG